MQTPKFVIVIKTSPEADYQTYVGWDHAYGARKEARGALARAKKIFHRARIVAAK